MHLASFKSEGFCNSIGNGLFRLSLPIHHVGYDCWRSRPINVRERYWQYRRVHYHGVFDAIDFQTSGKVFLQGYRLWGIRIRRITDFQVSIRLYRGSYLIAEKTGSYIDKSGDVTFEVYFSQEISLSTGILYTATAKIIAPRYYQRNMVVESASCFGVNVTFKTSSLKTTYRAWNEIAALIIRSPQCSK